ncbi:hypothetical protein M2404_004074 [Rheinheimera pacifica]|uniref:hypothetical protein n=1 Tax=Rheinheimera pacifica TaxID=173990 RepID=UPI0021671B59|nr:hypothetical protein [Rheinheimera pacifica]MCS4309697.1 hypothetical protein [Rheinheimera pacifica]
MDNLVRILRLIGLRKWTPTVIALFLLLAYIGLGSIDLAVHFSGDQKKKYQEIIDTSRYNLILIIIGLFVFNTIYVSVIDKVVEIWKTIILPDIKKNVEDISNKYLNTVRSETVDRVLDVAEKADIEKNVKSIFNKLYGSHCVKDKGLFQQLSRQIFPFLEPERVHRSSYTKKITIEDKNGEQLWHESCEFSLHCIGLDEDYNPVEEGRSVNYPLAYNPRMMVKALPQKLEDIWNLTIGKVNADGSRETIFESKNYVEMQNGKIVVKPDINFELDVTIEDGEFTCRFKKDIILTDAYTKIFITETSQVPENFYTLNTREPSCGMDIDIHLPTKWRFLDHTVYNADKNWSISSHPLNRLSCHTNGWVLPGIVFTCIWERVD